MTSDVVLMYALFPPSPTDAHFQSRLVGQTIGENRSERFENNASGSPAGGSTLVKCSNLFASLTLVPNSLRSLGPLIKAEF